MTLSVANALNPVPENSRKDYTYGNGVEETISPFSILVSDLFGGNLSTKEKQNQPIAFEVKHQPFTIEQQMEEEADTQPAINDVLKEIETYLNKCHQLNKNGIDKNSFFKDLYQLLNKLNKDIKQAITDHRLVKITSKINMQMDKTLGDEDCPDFNQRQAKQIITDLRTLMADLKQLLVFQLQPADFVKEVSKEIEKSEQNNGINSTLKIIASNLLSIQQLFEEEKNNQQKPEGGQQDYSNGNKADNDNSLFKQNIKHPLQQNIKDFAASGGKSKQSYFINLEELKPNKSFKEEKVNLQSFQTGPMNKLQQFMIYQTNQPAASTNQKVIEQISKYLSSSRLTILHNSVNEFRIKLHPDHLGELNIFIQNNPEGLTAKIIASTREAKEMIQSQLHHLKQSLAAEEIPLQKIDIDLSSFNNQQDSQYLNARQDHSGRDQQQNSRERMEDKREDEMLDEELTFSDWLSGGEKN
ncbi:flagellar hook-length control protein FliK [Scopulibacillus cellulosilyticus]|uniref:Flagellar hook-length control protein FliK n=1 Tax=Scopulibacillus cellulosilyticus TaxID=2665665 RepID=A0ABW2PT16_9BACL